MSKFTSQSVSIHGAPPINFEFEGDVGRAEYAGAKLYSEITDHPDIADLRVTDASGRLLADIVVQKLPSDDNITVSVIAVGSALLWSHYRWQQSSPTLGPISYSNNSSEIKSAPSRYSSQGTIVVNASLADPERPEDPLTTKYRKKPVVIEAVRVEEVLEHADAGSARASWPSWILTAYSNCTIGFESDAILIRTLEGTMRAERTDWIIKGVKGELYPCKPDIFEATYDRVDE